MAACLMRRPAQPLEEAGVLFHRPVREVEPEDACPLPDHGLEDALARAGRSDGGDDTSAHQLDARCQMPDARMRTDMDGEEKLFRVIEQLGMGGWSRCVVADR